MKPVAAHRNATVDLRQGASAQLKQTHEGSAITSAWIRFARKHGEAGSSRHRAVVIQGTPSCHISWPFYLLVVAKVRLFHSDAGRPRRHIDTVAAAFEDGAVHAEGAGLHSWTFTQISL